MKTIVYDLIIFTAKNSFHRKQKYINTIKKCLANFTTAGVGNESGLANLK